MTEQEPFNGRVALVTGASGGIGRAIALGLADAGATVALHYAAGADAAGELAETIASRGGSATTFGADLRDPDAALALAGRVVSDLGPIELLVNNAGIGRQISWEQVSLEDFDESYAINLRTPFLLTREALPAMVRAGFGRVLMMSSVAGLTGGIIGPHYAAAKSGLHGLTHHFASRVADAGVTVNALAPALIADTAMLPGDPAQLRSRVPAGRLGEPAEVADLALSVMRNGYLTNQVISIDGGTFPG
jgi:3-oxoacyl-[acyl-carrier protein] reductase